MSNVHLLFAVMCAAAALVLAASEVTSSLARPRMRRRDHLKQQPEIEEPPLRVRALPRDVTLYPRSSVSVKCRVRVASWALNSLLIGFYMYLDADTTLPISSNIPGVTVYPLLMSSKSWYKHEQLLRSSRHAHRYQSNYVTIGRLLSIGWPTYRFIPHGTNRFCCKASILINATRQQLTADEEEDGGSGHVDSDDDVITFKPTRKFYSSYFRLHKVRS